MILKFNTVVQLWNFVKTIHADSVFIDISGKMLTCKCYEDDVHLALEKFGATIFKTAGVVSKV